MSGRQTCRARFRSMFSRTIPSGVALDLNAAWADACRYYMSFRAAPLVALLFFLPAVSPAVIKEKERNILQEAEQALRSRDTGAALKALDTLIEQQPENAGALFW